MCRFIVYKGHEPIQLSHLVTRPRHSITNQAFESKLRFPSSRPMNADGFGIGWYDPLQTPCQEKDPYPETTSPKSPSENPSLSNGVAQRAEASSPMHPTGSSGVFEGDDADAQQLLADRAKERELENERPCIFKSISPAWSNANLERLAEKIRSPLIFAHVRASTMPGAPSEDNCHPWLFGKLMWMHNGEISGFTKIKRALQSSLPEELFLYPAGYTDSEWAFMLFLSKLKDPHARFFTHVELRDAMMETIKTLNMLLKDAEVTSPSLLNFVVSDGHTVVATRYISSRTSEASSLFFSSGTSFDEIQDGGMYRMTKADKRESIILIASEPLTFERSDWMEVKTNTMLVITPKMNLLQIPIIDEFWVAPQDPASQHRTTDFAISMGFGHGFAASKEQEVA
ncbi:putative cytoplasm protein [Kockovaella imperatae]|uniref:Putative cytoplasm protein n=1 Tax=Kockovaella imperatae TaxID=4999 RepID=A0A1Y1UQL0_9TREE|nr:putative cytoplasm protein [Kockovaella imperatae]ORX39847.1 putative cytoplasm protein [Kockovaella imperatae]